MSDIITDKIEMNHFKMVADKVGNCLKKVSFQICEDNFVGTFTKDNKDNNELWFCRDLRIKNSNKIKITSNELESARKNGYKTLLIVLESPHVEEYNKKFPIAPAPALGSTGCNLDKYFLGIISEYIPEGKYHVILSNAIQYQCSLGEDTEKYRDRVWLKLWLCKDFDRNFFNRIEFYRPDVIVNLCTKGSHKKDPLAPARTKTVINEKYLESICNNKVHINKTCEINGKITLNDLVQLEINKYSKGKSVISFQGTHPSSWHVGKNRSVKI